MTKRNFSRWGAYIILILVSLVAIFPIYWLFSSALKPANEIWAMPPSFIFHPDLSHFASVIRERGFLGFIANSIVVSFCSTLISLFLGLLCAHALTRYPIRGGKQVAFWMISLRMMPPI
ncbi:MAG: hypothetical protein ACUVRN_09900, partial [Candidatus Caldatribacteriaceae bacterium]